MSDHTDSMSNMTEEKREDLAASDSEIERALDELEDLIPSRTPSMKGSLIEGRYRVVRELGRGGFGRVLEVRHEQLGRRFAMKILHPELADDPDFIVRFQEEAKATSLIGHESIVFVTDFGRCPEHGYFLVMEYLDGESLTEVLGRRGSLTLRETLDFTVAVGSALSAVHGLGIVHCDLKPANIIHARRPGSPHAWKVLDFGTASIVTQAVESGSIFGTPRYMSPEHAMGLEVDPRADVFSLGVMIYEMLTGELPWAKNGWYDAQASARSAARPRPISELVEEVDVATSRVVLRALEVDPADRWPDVEAFVAAFRDSADVTYIPVADSLDERPAKGTFERSRTAPVVSSEAQREDSLLVERPGQSQRQWRMVFRTAERLRREYRRNMIARGLFVACDVAPPERRSFVSVAIVYQPLGVELRIEGRVVSHARSAPFGFGIELTPTSHAAVEHFFEKHGIRRSIGNAATLHLSGELPPRRWTPGQSFVLSLAAEPITVAELRARSTGLPFDVEEAIFSLFDLGVLEIEDLELSQRRDFHHRTSSTAHGANIEFDEEEIGRVLELAAQFRERGNYLAAQEVMERAAVVSSDPTPFVRELERLRAEFARAPRSSSELPAKSFATSTEEAGEDENTRGRLQRILGTDPLDD